MPTVSQIIYLLPCFFLLFAFVQCKSLGKRNDTTRIQAEIQGDKMPWDDQYEQDYWLKCQTDKSNPLSESTTQGSLIKDEQGKTQLSFPISNSIQEGTLCYLEIKAKSSAQDLDNFVWLTSPPTVGLRYASKLAPFTQKSFRFKLLKLFAQKGSETIDFSLAVTFFNYGVNLDSIRENRAKLTAQLLCEDGTKLKTTAYEVTPDKSVPNQVSAKLHFINQPLQTVNRLHCDAIEILAEGRPDNEPIYQGTVYDVEFLNLKPGNHIDFPTRISLRNFVQEFPSLSFECRDDAANRRAIVMPREERFWALHYNKTASVIMTSPPMGWLTSSSTSPDPVRHTLTLQMAYDAINEAPLRPEDKSNSTTLYQSKEKNERPSAVLFSSNLETVLSNAKICSLGNAWVYGYYPSKSTEVSGQDWMLRLTISNNDREMDFWYIPDQNSSPYRKSATLSVNDVKDRLFTSKDFFTGGTHSCGLAASDFYIQLSRFGWNKQVVLNDAIEKCKVGENFLGSQPYMVFSSSAHIVKSRLYQRDWFKLPLEY